MFRRGRSVSGGSAGRSPQPLKGTWALCVLVLVSVDVWMGALGPVAVREGRLLVICTLEKEPCALGGHLCSGHRNFSRLQRIAAQMNRSFRPQSFLAVEGLLIGASVNSSVVTCSDPCHGRRPLLRGRLR